MKIETELKFVGTADALSQLRKLPLLKQTAGARRATTHSLVSTYYDTESLDLRAGGFVLRVRNEGTGFVQTVKGAERTDLVTRLELNDPLLAERPDVAAIADEGVRASIAQLVGDHDLKPLFSVRVSRTRLVVSPKKGIEVEIAFDTGEIVLPEGQQPPGDGVLSVPVCEVEFELIKGDLGDLVAFAGQVTSGLNLTLSLQSKSERGFALSLGKLDAPVYAEPIELAETATTNDALCTLLRRCLSHLLGNWSAVTVARDAEGVHQMRVALRRLRSALSLFDDPFRSSLGEIESEVRWIGNVLGGARDLDVFHAEIFKPVAEAHGSDDRLQELASVVHARRRSAWQDVMDALESERFRLLALAIAEATHSRPWARPDDQSGVADMPAQDFCRVKLGHKWRQAMKMGERIQELDVEERHALRIRLKKLRYGIDLFGSLFSKRRVRQFLKRLGRLQDVLGEMNDAAVARSLVVQLVDDQRGTSRELPVAYAGGLIVGWHVARSRGRHRILRRQWQRFSRLKPFWRTPATIAKSPGAD